MPTVDFRPLLPSPDHNQRSTDSPVDGKRADLSQPSPPRSRLRLTGPQLANLAFVLAACVGALFSAAYLFKGDELLHEVAAWPRELFSGRPAVINPTPTATENSGPVLAAVPLPDQSAPPINNSGGPFSSSRKLLGLDSSSSTTLPNGRTSFPFSSPAQPLNALNTAAGGSDALSSSLMNGVTSVSPQGSAVTDAATSATTAAQTAAATASQTASSSATAATSRAARSANRISSTARTAGARRASRAANLRSARPSGFKRAMAAIARSFRGPNAARSKVAQTKSMRTQTNGRTARATRSANHRSSAAQRRANVASRTSRAAKTATAKSSIRAAGSRKTQASSKIANRSAIMSRSTGTMSSGLSRGGASSIRSTGPSGFSSSAAGFRSLGSMGGGHGFGGGGGRMGLGGGHGIGRGR